MMGDSPLFFSYPFLSSPRAQKVLPGMVQPVMVTPYEAKGN
jgi:hypothetical protein